MTTNQAGFGARRLTIGLAALAVATGGLLATNTLATASTHTPTVWHATPDPTAEGVGLTAVSADGSHDAWAVGVKVNPSHPTRAAKPAVEHWNGKGWQQATAPAEAVELDSVSAPASDDVWVSGLHSELNGPARVWHFNGRSWKQVASKGLPHLNTGSVQAVGSHIWLVGDVDPGRHDGGAVIATYDTSAKRWSVLRADHDGGFFGVTALSASSAWAVGSTNQYAGNGHPLIAHWDGTKWTTQAFPDIDGQLAGVAAHSDSDVMAVGTDHNQGTGAGSLMTMQWDGTHWTPTALSPHLGYLFSAVSAGPGSEYWAAAGGSSGGAAFHERFLDGAWHTVRGAQGSVKVASGRKYRDPIAVALARVPGTDKTLSVGYGTRAGTHHYPSPAAALESTTK
jgi:hypothetical protein